MCEKQPTPEVEELRALIESLVDENVELTEKLGKFQKRCAELLAKNDELQTALDDRIPGAPRSFLYES